MPKTVVAEAPARVFLEAKQNDRRDRRGVMGQALAKGLMESGLVDSSRIWAATKTAELEERVAAELGVEVETHYGPRIPDTGMLLLCVKPAQVANVLSSVRASLDPDTVIISIAAGVTIRQIEAALGTKNPVIRAMPNTPSTVRHGMTVVCGGTHATEDHIAQARKVFEAVGLCLPVDEVHFDAVTALSGSGPAYIFLIIEALADAGVRVGLPRGTALTLVTQTVLGATKMVQASGRHPASLRDDVTTPAGCTIGGLLMLEDGKIRSVLARAVEEAARIAAGLGKPKSANE